jgi:hypothetical protein
MRQISPDRAATENVIDILPGLKKRMQTAQNLMEDSLGELSVDGWKADEVHAFVIFTNLGSGVLRHAIQGYIVASLDKPRR